MRGARLAPFMTPIVQELRAPREVAHASNDLRCPVWLSLKGLPSYINASLETKSLTCGYLGGHWPLPNCIRI